MLVETARQWRDLGFYSGRRGGRFCIHGVTGPDEYNTVVDNNTFTNLMARENLWLVAATVELLRRERPVEYAELADKTALQESEAEEWQRAADSLYIPLDSELGIHSQDDSFLDKKPWDFENTPADRYPLLLFYHPLVIYRHKVIKQADIVLAMFLLGHEFSIEQKRRNFDYYDPLTTGDSSLSVCIQSMLAYKLGYLDRALEYARYALLMDLADVGGNVNDGCHIASMGGTWMVLIYGFAGLRDYGGCISFCPQLPSILKRMCFPMTVQGQMLEVDIDQDAVVYWLRKGERLTLYHHEEKIELTRQALVAKRKHCGDDNE